MNLLEQMDQSATNSFVKMQQEGESVDYYLVFYYDFFNKYKMFLVPHMKIVLNNQILVK